DGARAADGAADADVAGDGRRGRPAGVYRRARPDADPRPRRPGLVADRPARRAASRRGGAHRPALARGRARGRPLPDQPGLTATPCMRAHARAIATRCASVGWSSIQTYDQPGGSGWTRSGE